MMLARWIVSSAPLWACLATAVAPQNPPAPLVERTAANAHEFLRSTGHPSPREVMAWLQAASARRLARPATVAQARQPEAPAPARPAGAGRWVVAVLVDGEIDVDPHEVLGIPRRDVLVLASPGPVVRPEELALLEHAVREQRLALCLVMVRAGPTSAAADQATPAARALQRRLAGAATEQSATPPTVRHARLQASLLTTASDVMREAARQGRLRAGVAVLPERGEGVEFVAPWYERPTPSEVSAEQASADEGARRPLAQPVGPGPPVPYPAPGHNR